MPPDRPLILAFDTSAARCAAVLLRGDNILVERHEDFGRAQVEHLMPMLESMLAKAMLEWRTLDAVAVCTGPGNFTGTRIGVSTARGLAMSLNIPAVGVSVFEAAALNACKANDQIVPIGVQLPRDQIAVQSFKTGQPPRALSEPVILRSGPISPYTITHIAKYAGFMLAKTGDLPRPAPLYLRPPEAAPAKDKPPVILHDT